VWSICHCVPGEIPKKRKGETYERGLFKSTFEPETFRIQGRNCVNLLGKFSTIFLDAVNTCSSLTNTPWRWQLVCRNICRGWKYILLLANNLVHCWLKTDSKVFIVLRRYDFGYKCWIVIDGRLGERTLFAVCGSPKFVPRISEISLESRMPIECCQVQCVFHVGSRQSIAALSPRFIAAFLTCKQCCDGL
jgi:hypothetical protein